MSIQRVVENEIAEQATGCRGAGGYREYAASHGYKHLEVLNWSSSAGDWQFIISRNGQEWRVLNQSNNWPRAGFSYSISDEVFYGTAEDVFLKIECLYG